MIAYERGAKGNSDDYTMLHATPSFALNTIVFKKLAYDLHRDFTPITNIAQGFGYLMLAYPSVQATNVKELIAFAKTQNKPLTYGTPGVGHTLHLATELFNARAGLNMPHVPYKGVALALNALLGGEISVIILQPPAASRQPVWRRSRPDACGRLPSPVRGAGRVCPICRRYPSRVCRASSCISPGMRGLHRRKRRATLLCG